MVFAVPSPLVSPHGVSVPRQILLGFTRVTIPPGGSITARIRAPAKRLRLLDFAGKHQLLQGDYELRVGGRPPGASRELYPLGDGEPLRRVLRVR